MSPSEQKAAVRAGEISGDVAVLHYASLAMAAPQIDPTGRIVRFGVFEADLASGELRRQGVRVRLQEQPFKMLALLLERPGELVTREDLRQKLWPADTFVDFDHSLNTAVNKLREALRDSAASPRFVETVARRGYRFLAPLEAVEPASAQATVGDRKHAVHAQLGVPLPRRGLTRSLFALIQVMYLAFYLAALFHLRAIDAIADGSLPGWEASALLVAVLVTAGAGLPLRCYLLSAVAFDYQRLGEKFRRIFLVVLLLDEFWAIAPFLLASRIGFGAAFAATALLVYVPFSERTLIRLAYSNG